MSPVRRVRKLALANPLRPKRDTTNNMEKASQQQEPVMNNNVRALTFTPPQTTTETAKTTTVDEDEGKIGVTEQVKNDDNTEAMDVERQSGTGPDSPTGDADDKLMNRRSADYSNLLSLPSVSTMNLLEEIEADNPPQYSLVKPLDHTLHTVTNLRTCTRLSRVGANLTPRGVDEDQGRTIEESEPEETTDSIVRKLEKEAFIQKTRMGQAEKILKMSGRHTLDLKLKLRILLLARLRYDAVNLELEQIKMLGPEPAGDKCGQITVTDVEFRLSDQGDTERGARCFLSHREKDTTRNCYFICTASHRGELQGSTLSCGATDGCLRFPVRFRFDSLRRDFSIRLELYQLKVQTKKWTLKGFQDSARVRKWRTRLSHKEETDEGKDCDWSFTCLGSATLTLDDVKRRDGVKAHVDFHTSHPSFRRSVTVTLLVRVNVEEKMSGFLDVFSDTTHCWDRLWCCHVDHFLWFWRYPEDRESEKEPLLSVPLPQSQDGVRPVTSDVCIRPHSFVVGEGPGGVLLSARAHREMVTWIEHLTAVIESFREWSPDFLTIPTCY